LQQYKGHSDFVKTLLTTTISSTPILISGGADAKIIVWDILTGKKIHTLRDKSDKMMALQSLAIDPVESTEERLVLVSGSSDPFIRRWSITLESATQIYDAPSPGQKEKANDSILQHETSVYALLFDPTLSAQDGEEAGDLNLFTASADGTAKSLSRQRGWVAEETFEHGDYVRAVAVTSEWVITAGRDEDVKVWDRSSGTLEVILEGHFEEVTALVVLPDITGVGEHVVSVSIDGTVRTWPLDKKGLLKIKTEAEEKRKGVVKEEVPVVKESLMTAEEEAELAELMDSD
jgi:WD40 repeat protein